MDLAYGSGGAVQLSADEFRAESKKSCVPGVHTDSGGLLPSDVSRVCLAHGVQVDWGPGGRLTRWPAAEMKTRLSGPNGAHVLGDYDQMGIYSAQPSFKGDHSAWAHDYDPSDDTYCFHDPLRKAPIRLPASVLMKYWRKPGSETFGLAGFVKIKEASDVAKIVPVSVEGPYNVKLKAGINLYDTDFLILRPVSVGGTTTGYFQTGTGFIAVDVTTKGVHQMLFVRNRDVTFTPVVPPADCNAQVAAAIIEDRKKAKIVYS